MTKVLGIVNFESPYVKVTGIGDYRTISAASILGRYRIIDFTMSNFSNSGIKNIKVFIKNRPRSVVEHLQQTNYNINEKKGKIHLLYGEKEYTNEIYNTDIASLKANLMYIEESSAEYVVVAPAHFVYTQDFNEVIEFTKKKKNDITVMYQPTDSGDVHFLMGDVVVMDNNKKISRFTRQRGRVKNCNVSLETYVMKKSLFVELINKAANASSLYSLSNIISDSCKDLKVYGYRHVGYCACINSLRSYYDCCMDLRSAKALKNFINEDWPIYTATNDSCPTLYKQGGEVKNSIVANGCIIEGKVFNSIISRSCVIEKGAIVKDSIIMPDVVIEEGAYVENIIADRFAHISDINKLVGTKEEPLYIKRGDHI